MHVQFSNISHKNKHILSKVAFLVHDQNWLHGNSRILLSAIPKGISKEFVVLDCYWANSAANFKCTLSIGKNTSHMLVCDTLILGI